MFIVSERWKEAYPDAMVDAMFMAEMKNLLLTAGHDLGKLSFFAFHRNWTGQDIFYSWGGSCCFMIKFDWNLLNIKKTFLAH